MGVIKAEAGWLGDEGDALHAMRRHEGRAFLEGAVDVAWNHLPVPMHELRHVGLVIDIDDGPLPFLESDQRSGKLTVIDCGRDDVVGRKLDRAGTDADGLVRGRCWSGTCHLSRKNRIVLGKARGQRARSDHLQETTPIKRH